MSAFGLQTSSNPNFNTGFKAGNPASNYNGDGFRGKTEKQSGQNSKNGFNFRKKTFRSETEKGSKKQVIKRKNKVKDESPESDSMAEPTPVIYYPKSATPMQVFTSQEISLAGPLISNPESLGFRKHGSKPRPIPRFFLLQKKLLVAPELLVDDWDIKNQEKMIDMEKAKGDDVQGLYEDFQKMREIERKEMEKKSLVDAENTRKDLNDAILFRGSCLDMCPTFERVRRALENNVKHLERDPITKKISRERAVKAFSRPAAGQPPPLPSDVRPPHILVKTLNYLVDEVISSLPESYSFIWDRTRSIRQDFTYQNYSGPEAIDCNERIVRIHLICLHIMAGSNVEYSQQQELEQMNKALQTLIEIYEDVRNRGGSSPNEAEFRAYYLISHLRDPELERVIQTLPSDIFGHNLVQKALMFRGLILQNNIIERSYTNLVDALNLFEEFFKVVYSDETPVLLACLMETHFNEIRFYAMKSMSRCYHSKGKAYDASRLQTLLGFDSVEKLVTFSKHFDVDFSSDENGALVIDLFNRDKLENQYKLNSIHDKPKLAQAYSSQLDSKISQGQSIKDYVNSGRSNGDLGLGLDKTVTNHSSIPIDAKTFNGRASSITGALKHAQTQNVTFGSQEKQNNLQNNFLQNTAIQSKNAFLLPGSKNGSSDADSFASNFASGPISSKNVNDNIFNQDITEIKNPSEPKHKTPEKLPKQILDFGKKNFAVSFNAHPQQKTIIQSTNTSRSDFSLDKSNSTVSNGTEPVNKPLVKSDIMNTPVQFNRPQFVSIGKANIELKATQPKPRLTESTHYHNAANTLLNEILLDVVHSEIKNFAPKIIEDESFTREKRALVDSLSLDLYNAFIDEFVYMSSLSAVCENFEKIHLKRKAIKKVIGTAQKAKEKYDMKKKKREEFLLVSKQLGVPSKRKISPSRQDSISLLHPHKRKAFLKKNPYNDLDSSDIVSIDQERNIIKELWEPIDLYDAFFKYATSNIKLDIVSDYVEVNFLLVVESWESSCSRWLNSKLSLTANSKSLTYENLLKDNQLRIKLLGLPNTYTNDEYFGLNSFILFECGITKSNKVDITLEHKLRRDGKVLRKIIELVKKYSNYRVQLLLLYWDTSESNTPLSKVSELLDLVSIFNDKEIKNFVSGILFCDMSLQPFESSPIPNSIDGYNINEKLINSFIRLGRNFNSDLTIKGIKHQLKSNETRSLQKEILSNVESTRKSKSNKKISYLEKHIIYNSPSIPSKSPNRSHSSSTGVYSPRQNLHKPTTPNSPSIFLPSNLSTPLRNNNSHNFSALLNSGCSTSASSPLKFENFESRSSREVSGNTTGNLSEKINALRELAAAVRSRHGSRKK